MNSVRYCTRVLLVEEQTKQMKNEDITIDSPNRALGDTPKERFCLRCKASFWSDGFGERICQRCKGSNAWRTAAPISAGGSRRR